MVASIYTYSSYVHVSWPLLWPTALRASGEDCVRWTPRHTRRETPSADTPHRAINSPPTKHTFLLSPHSYFFPHEWELRCVLHSTYTRWKQNISLNRWGLSFFSASLGRSSYCTCSVLQDILWKCLQRISRWRCAVLFLEQSSQLLWHEVLCSLAHAEVISQAVCQSVTLWKLLCVVQSQFRDVLFKFVASTSPIRSAHFPRSRMVLKCWQFVGPTRWCWPYVILLQQKYCKTCVKPPAKNSKSIKFTYN